MIGRRFGRLVCLSATTAKNADKHRLFVCRCDCNGGTIQVQGNHLRSGRKTHCGCLNPPPRRVEQLRIDPSWEG